MTVQNLAVDQPLVLTGSPPINIAAGAGAGKVLTSDGSGNYTAASPVTGFLSPTAKTTTYTAAANDHVIAPSGTFTVTSPAAASARIFGVSNKGTGVVTVSAAAGSIFGSGPLNAGVASFALATGGSAVLISDGTNWYVIAGGPLVETHGVQNLAFTSPATQVLATVTHGLGVTPTKIFLTPGNIGASLYAPMYDTVGATTFRIIQNVPTTFTNTVPVSWRAVA